MPFTSLPRDATKTPIQIGTLGGTSTLIDFGASATTATGGVYEPYGSLGFDGECSY